MDIICVGDALIDMVAYQGGKILQDVTGFKRVAGGACANVAVGCSRFGKKSAFIGRVGADDFGYHLRDVFIENNVNVDFLQYDSDARTALAFIALPTPTTRDFLFYRNPSADMRLDWSQFDADFLKNTKVLHFSSITLVQEPSRTSTLKAVGIAKEGGSIISYDPNLRINLWSDLKTAKSRIIEAIPLADIIKVNDEELKFITGHEDILHGSKVLLDMGPRLCLITMGSKGSFYVTSKFSGYVPVFDVHTVDTTGCGDSFVSTFLSFISEKSLETFIGNEWQVKKIALAATAASSITSTKKGVISSLPYRDEVMEFLKKAKSSPFAL
ncbi:MAG: hypothetical protein JW997_00680 [Actinobacteria bacterium]|nr:hypothetical protein [Actinomycetota bacterium]